MNLDSLGKITIPRFMRTRFAPSPTGYLHKGHVLNAILCFGLAKLVGAEIILRIEDHDVQRSKPEHIQGIIDDLKWLGFQWDSLEFQSSRVSRYQEVTEKLKENGYIYTCECNRKRLLELQTQAEICYDGFCRTAKHYFRAGKNTLRCKMPESELCFNDLQLGNNIQNPSRQCGDLQIFDRNQSWSYQFAVVVDDLDQGVDMVIRGEDILASTGRQMALRKIIQPSAPMLSYFHHPLLIDSQGKKLSKRQQSEGICQWRLAGKSPESLLAEVWNESGFSPVKEHLSGDEIPDFLLNHFGITST